MKKQINNVNVEKASANAKANSLIALDVLKSVKEKNAGLFKTSLGTKTEIYKKELFEGANEKQIKSLRKKFRNKGLLCRTLIEFNSLDGCCPFVRHPLSFR